MSLGKPQISLPVHVVADGGVGRNARAEKRLNEFSRLELGAKTYQAMRALEKEKKEREKQRKLLRRSYG